MANRYFAGTRIGSFLTSGAAASATTSGTFDSAYVANSIRLAAGGSADGILNATVSGELWLSFDYMVSGSNSNFDTHRILEVTNSVGLVIFYITARPYLDFHQINAYSWNGTTYVNTVVNSVSSSMGVVNVRTRVTVRLVFGSSSTSIVYVGNTPLATAYAIGNAAFNNAAAFSLKGPLGGTTDYNYYAEVAACDFDCRASRLLPAPVNALSGTNLDGTGAYTDVNDDSAATGFNLPAVGNKRGVTHSALAVSSGLLVGALCINANAAYASPAAGVKAGVRFGGTNYSATSALALGSGSAKPNFFSWPLNPSSSLKWTQTDVNNTELYAEAA